VRYKGEAKAQMWGKEECKQKPHQEGRDKKRCARRERGDDNKVQESGGY